MQTFFGDDGYRFFFSSNESDPREPAHVHVRKSGAEAKFWLRPIVTVAGSAGMDAPTLRELARVVGENRELIKRAWDEYFS
jgi:hypothetical protein